MAKCIWSALKCHKTLCTCVYHNRLTNQPFTLQSFIMLKEKLFQTLQWERNWLTGLLINMKLQLAEPSHPIWYYHNEGLQEKWEWHPQFMKHCSCDHPFMRHQNMTLQLQQYWQHTYLHILHPLCRAAATQLCYPTCQWFLNLLPLGKQVLTDLLAMANSLSAKYCI